MKNSRSATGFVAQAKIMTYATPQIEHIDHDGFEDWYGARVAAGLDWEPRLAPVYTGSIGLPLEIPDVQAVMNGRQYLSVASSRYELISHNMLGQVVAAVQKAHSGAKITAIVVLDHGRRVGVRVTHGEAYLPFDPSAIAKETWVWLRHDAKGALYVMENAQRMNCTNQLGWFTRGVETDLRVRHTGDTESKIGWLIDTFSQRADWAKWEKEMTELHATTVSTDQFSRFVSEWIPLPDPEKTSPTRAINAQLELLDQWAGYERELGANLYSAYQAITEYEDQHRTARGAAGQFIRAIQPNPRKQQALDTLRELVAA